MPSLDVESLVVESIQFDADSFRLEGELIYPQGSVEARWAAVLAGSHPYLGGNMHNNVVQGLADGLATREMATLRFNYRGVGRSEGPSVDLARHMAAFWETSHVPAEKDHWKDVQGAVDFMQSIIGSEVPLALIGYSFGCSLLPQVRSQRPVRHVLIAPPLGKHDYEAFVPLHHPILVIVSQDDFTLEGAGLQSWFDRLRAPKRLVQAPLDNHFFRGHERWLVDTVVAFLNHEGR